MTLWRSVRREHAGGVLTGEGAARYPGRYNGPGVRAVYLADCPSGCALELLASYAAPEAIATQVLFEVEIDAELVDFRDAGTRRRYGATIASLTATDDYGTPRRIGARMLRDERAGAIVPAATVARAFNVVIFADVWNAFRIRSTTALACDDRLGALTQT